MTSHQPYRPAFSIEAALQEIEKGRGILYDPKVVDACLRLIREKGYQFKMNDESALDFAGFHGLRPPHR